MELESDEKEFNLKEGMQAGQMILAEKMKNKYSYQQYIEQFSKEELPFLPNITIPDTKLFLGFAGLDYRPDNVVAPNISIIAEEAGRIVPKSRVIIIIGRKGSGKSILEANICLDNFRNKFNIPTLVIDPSPTPEFYKHKQSLTEDFSSVEMNKKFDDYEYKFNVKFRGYKIKVYKPAFDSMGFKEDGVDVNWSLALKDFKELFNFSKLDAIQSMQSVLELQDNAPASDIITQILSSEKFQTFDDVIQALKGKRFVMENEEEFKATGTSFKNRLNAAILMGVFDKGIGTKDNIIDDLMNYDAIVLRSKAKTGEEAKILAKYFVYLQIAITKVLQERLKAVSGSREEKVKSRLNHQLGLQVIIDEADTLAPNAGTSYLKTLIENIATKYRKAGVTLGLATQNLELLDEVLTAQADSILTSRLDNKANVVALRRRGIHDESIDVLRHLQIEKKNSYGFKVSEWAYINQQNRIQSFYPALPLSTFKH